MVLSRCVMWLQNQNTVILFLLEPDQETIAIAFVATAFCLKFVEVVHLILRQVTPDCLDIICRALMLQISCKH